MREKIIEYNKCRIFRILLLCYTNTTSVVVVVVVVVVEVVLMVHASVRKSMFYIGYNTFFTHGPKISRCREVCSCSLRENIA